MQFPLVYIIVLNYKTWQDTVECLESLLKLQYPNYQIIVIDNASPDHSVEMLLKWAKGELVPNFDIPLSIQHLVLPLSQKPIKIRFLKEEELQQNLEIEPPQHEILLIKAKENKGYSAGNNIGLRLALQQQAAYAWILNNDTIVTADSLTYLVQYAEKKRSENKKIGLIGSKIFYYHQPEIIQCAGGATFNPWTTFSHPIGAGQVDKGQYDKEIKNLGIVAGASCLVSTNFLQEVGLLAEEYFLYLEEMDWATRARQKQWALGYAYQAKIYHKEGKTTGGGSKKEVSLLADYYFNRNRLIFADKFHSFLGKFCIYCIFGLIILNRLRKKQWQKARNLWKALKNPYQPYPAQS